MILSVKCRYMPWPHLWLFKTLKFAQGTHHPSNEENTLCWAVFMSSSCVHFCPPRANSVYATRRDTRVRLRQRADGGGTGGMINESNGALTMPTTMIVFLLPHLSPCSFQSHPHCPCLLRARDRPPAHLRVPLRGLRTVHHVIAVLPDSAWPDAHSIGESLRTPDLGSHEF
jgi:hypothetical protein